MEQQSGRADFCAQRGPTVAKFALLYFVSLSFTVLIFTAVSQEKVTRAQARWWWALLGSLLLTCSSALTALVLTFCAERYYVDETPEQGATPETGAAVDLSPDGAMALNPPVPTGAEPGYSSSFKTVLTINSALPSNTGELDQERERERERDKLAGKSPLHSPILTIVDARRRLQKSALLPAAAQGHKMRESKSAKSKPRRLKKRKSN